jgi:FAD/FMN-containing dehydrogenase
VISRRSGLSKYGTARDWVLGLKVVLPTGEIIKTVARTLKSNVGHDLTRLIMGSEGTLGVITEASLKVRPAPEALSRLFTLFRQDRVL